MILTEINSGLELISGSFSFSSYFDKVSPEVDDGEILRLRKGNHGITLRERNHGMKFSSIITIYTNC